MHVDLVLRGGTICDRTRTPARVGDVIIDGGRIIATGRFDGPARRVIDVDGLIVAPGFIDVHTHYDAQVVWDALCTPVAEWEDRLAHAERLARERPELEIRVVDVLRPGDGRAPTDYLYQAFIRIGLLGPLRNTFEMQARRT